MSLIRWTPGANMGPDVSISPPDGKSQLKPMMEHSKNDECVVCTVGVNTHHYAWSLCSGSVPRVMPDQNRRPPEIQKRPY